MDNSGKQKELALEADPKSSASAIDKSTSNGEIPFSNQSAQPDSPSPGGINDPEGNGTSKRMEKGKAKAAFVDDDTCDSNSLSSSMAYDCGDPFMQDELERALMDSRVSSSATTKLGESSGTSSHGTPSVSSAAAYGEFTRRTSDARSVASSLVRLADTDYSISEDGHAAATPDAVDSETVETAQTASPPDSASSLLTVPQVSEQQPQTTGESTDPAATSVVSPSVPASSFVSGPPSASVPPSGSALASGPATRTSSPYPDSASDALAPSDSASNVCDCLSFPCGAPQAFAPRDSGGSSESDLPSLSHSPPVTVLTWQGSQVTDPPSGSAPPAESPLTRPAFVPRSPRRPRPSNAHEFTPLPRMRVLELGPDDLHTSHWDNNQETESRATRFFELPDSPFVEEGATGVDSPAPTATEIDSTTVQFGPPIDLSNTGDESEELNVVSFTVDELDPFAPIPVTYQDADMGDMADETVEIADVSRALDFAPPSSAEFTASAFVPATAAESEPTTTSSNDAALALRHEDAASLRTAAREAARAVRAAQAAATAADTFEAVLPPPTTFEVRGAGLLPNSALDLAADFGRMLHAQLSASWSAFLQFRIEEGSPNERAWVVFMGLTVMCIPLMSLYFPYDESPSALWRRWVRGEE